MIRNLALDETELAVREAVTRRLKADLMPAGSARAGYAVVWAALAELSVLAAPLEEAQGGLGGGLPDAMLILEPLGRCGIPAPFLEGLCGPAALARHFPRCTELRDLLSGVAAGRPPLSIAWLEPGQGWSRRPNLTYATEHTLGWSLTGVKTVVRWGGQASHFLVSAHCGGAPGIFLVPAAASGVSVVSCMTADGQEAADLTFRDLVLPATARLDDGNGAAALDFALDALAALSLSEAVGAMDACLDMTVEYLKSRDQFGGPLSRQQALQHRLVDMYSSCELAWSMAIDAVTALDTGVSVVERALRISGAKAYIGPAGRRVAQEALQLHGATGMTMDYPLGRFLARLTLIDLGHGDPEWHLARTAQLLETTA